MGAVKLDDLRSIRKALGKSQGELAEMLSISARAVQSYEQGWRAVPPYVQKLAALLLYLARRKDRPELRPCWGVCSCDGELRSRCLAYQCRAGDLCWIITGDCYRAVKQGSWQAKFSRCADCPATRQWLNA